MIDTHSAWSAIRFIWIHRRVDEDDANLAILKGLVIGFLGNFSFGMKKNEWKQQREWTSNPSGANHGLFRRASKRHAVPACVKTLSL